MNRFFLAACATAVAATLSLKADPEPPEKRVKIAFQLEANLAWVDVWLDAKGPFRMVVDTGASTTIILPDAAKEKGLIKASGETWGESTRFVKVAKAMVGTLDVADIKVAVMSVPQISNAAGFLEGKADGVLGFNVLSRYRMTIDYKEQTIAFVENGFVPPDPEQSLPGIRRPGKCWFGVQVEDADPRDVRSSGYDGGMLVNTVTELSPAEKAGIREGDIIVEIAGTPTTRPAALRDFLSRSAPGQKVVVTLVRKGEIWEKDLVIGKMPEPGK